MRKTAVILALALAFISAGCASMFEKDYHYSEPYGQRDSLPEGDALEIHNRSMLLGEILSLVGRHESYGEFRFSNYTGSPSDDLAYACFEVKNGNSLGAYAVEDISYDTSRIVSYYTARVDISYKKTAEEIESVVSAAAAELPELLRDSLTNFDRELVIRMNSTTVDADYLKDLAREIYYEDPTLTVTEPELRISVYPNEGLNRIFELKIDYGTDVPVVRNAAAVLRSALDAAQENINGDGEAGLALAAAQYLSGLLEEREGGGAFYATAYGALVEHSADSKGIALAYKSLCGRLGIECLVVEGSRESPAAGGSFWNIICIDGEYYHVDLTAFAASPGSGFLLRDDQLWGRYVWDSAEYPVCSGSLSYDRLVNPEGETEGPEPPAPPETGGEEQPGETEPQPTEQPEESAPPTPEENEKDT